jgi:hypothetical protein
MGVLLYASLIAVGLLLAYGGHSLYTFALFALGAVVAAGGYYVVAAGGQPGTPGLFSVLGVGLVGGLVFLFVQTLVVLAGGFAVGWVAVGTLGVPDDALQTVGGLVGAGLSLLLYALAVIAATAGVGALVVSKAVAAGPSADLSHVLATTGSSPAFWFVFVTGGLVQLGAFVSDGELEGAAGRRTSRE